jgi:hypothetical protein
MRIFIAGGLAASLSVSLVPSAPAYAAPLAAPADAHMAAALALAQLINESNDLALQVEQMLGAFAVQGFATDPNLLALKQEYPGVEKVFIDTIRPIIMSELTLMLPDYNQATAEFFASHFTLAEIGELATFWGSEPGQAMIRSISSNADFSAMTKEIVGQIGDEGDISISGGAIDADKRKAVTSGLRALTPQQRIAIMRFGLTPVGRKMAGLVNEKNEIDRKWANSDLSPAAQARVDREVGDAVLAFIEEEERKRAAAP